MGYRAEVDGLRAIAIIPVILYHADITLFSGGYVGVDVFFVISGFLITTIILSEKSEGDFSLASFYERRARRILPAQFVVLIASIIFAWFWLPPEDLVFFADSLRAVSTFTSNIYFFSTGGYFDSSAELKPLLHTWSLAVEEQFYLIFPLFVVVTWKFGKSKVLWLLCSAAVLSFLLASFATKYYPRPSFFLLPTRGWELLIGVLVAYYMFRKEWSAENQYLSFLGFGMIAYSIFFYTSDTPFPSAYTLVPTLGTALVILYSGSSTLVYKVLSNRVLVGIGLISYSTYLWHQPLYSFIRHRSFSAPSVYIMTLMVLITFVLAYLTWRFVESPFRSRKKFSRKNIFLLALISSVLIYLVGYVLGKLDTSAIRYNSADLEIYSETKTADHYWTSCLRSELLLHPMAKCMRGQGEDIVLLTGDSHAATLAKPLVEALGEKSRVYVATAPGCPPLLGFISSVNQSSYCSDITGQMLNYVKTTREVKTVILSAQWSLYASGKRFKNTLGGNEKGEAIYYFKENGDSNRNSENRIDDVVSGYIEVINELLTLNVNVILVDQIPVAGWDVPKRFLMLSKYGYDKTDNLSFSFPFSVYENRNNFLEKMYLLESNKYSVVRTADLLCDKTSNRCETVKFPDLYFMDDNHLSYSGSSIIVDGLVHKMGALE